MIKKTELQRRVEERAKADGLPPDHEMVLAARKFTDAANGYYYEKPQTVKIKAFLSAFARARRLWCEYSGEPLA